jgi:threonine dehydrogenase-like Zn-dependent dehydrogenase
VEARPDFGANVLVVCTGSIGLLAMTSRIVYLREQGALSGFAITAAQRTA